MEKHMKRYFLLPVIAFGLCIYIVANQLKSNDSPQTKLPTPDIEFVGPEITITEEDLIDINQMHCLATNIYHEARGESYAGKVAVANVTMNRVHNNKFPNTICGVVYQAQTRENWKGNIVPKRNKCQFSWYCDGKSDDIVLTTLDGSVIKERMQAWEMSLLISSQMIRGNLIDITTGSTHYYNSDLANPYWAEHYVQVVQIDSHSFLKSE